MYYDEAQQHGHHCVRFFGAREKTWTKKIFLAWCAKVRTPHTHTLSHLSLSRKSTQQKWGHRWMRERKRQKRKKLYREKSEEAESTAMLLQFLQLWMMLCLASVSCSARQGEPQHSPSSLFSLLYAPWSGALLFSWSNLDCGNFSMLSLLWSSEIKSSKLVQPLKL